MTKFEIGLFMMLIPVVGLVVISLAVVLNMAAQEFGYFTIGCVVVYIGVAAILLLKGD